MNNDNKIINNEELTPSEEKLLKLYNIAKKSSPLITRTYLKIFIEENISENLKISEEAYEFIQKHPDL